MKINKNVMSLAMFLSLVNPTQADDSSQEINKLTGIETTIIEEAASAATQGIIAAIHQALASHNQIISNHDAVALLQQLATNLVDGTHFQINGHNYVVSTTLKQISIEEQNAIITMTSDFVDTAISTLADEIKTAETQTISQADAILMLQQCAKSLTIGTTFEFNGTIYTVQNLTENN